MPIHKKQRCVNKAFPPVLSSRRDQASVSDSGDIDQKLGDEEQRADRVGGQECVWLQMKGDVGWETSSLDSSVTFTRAESDKLERKFTS